MGVRSAHGDTFSQNFKAYKGHAPQSLRKDHSFTAGYATAADRYQTQQSSVHSNIQAPPFLNEFDFTGQNKDRLVHQLNRSNMPHLKRVMNN